MNKRLKKLIVYNLPFSFFRATNDLIRDAQVKTVLDLACGDGELMDMINHNRKFIVDGVDLYPKYLSRAKKLGMYRNLYKRNVLYFKPLQKYDMVFWSNNIEHLDKKDGEKLAKKILSWAKKIVIILTPYGYCETHIHDGNSLQDHKSGWFPSDFKKLGYKCVVKGFSAMLVKDMGNKWIETPQYKLFQYLTFPFFEMPEPYLICYYTK